MVKLRCAADLGRKTVHEEEWCRHETALFVPCAIAGFTIPFGLSLPMAQHKAVFCLRCIMASISYNSKLAEHFESAVAAILFKHVMDICESSQVPSFECKDLQFSLGFSDVEYYSALKTLREKGYLQTKSIRGGGKVYTPLYELLSFAGADQ